MGFIVAFVNSGGLVHNEGEALVVDHGSV